jgi:spore coat protein U-like protein
MKNSYVKILIISLVTLVVLTAPWGQAAKASNGDTAVLGVSVTVGENCTISGANLVFPDFGGATVSADTNVNVTCTSQTTNWTVSFDSGQNNFDEQTRGMAGPAPVDNETIQYNIYEDFGHTAILGDNGNTNTGMPTGGVGTDTVTVFGVIFTQPGPFSGGSYSDTVTMTLNF